MRIELFKSTPDRAGRYFVKFDDGSTMRVYRQTAEDLCLYTGRELSDEEMSELILAHGKMSAKMRAVRIVSATSVSKQDLEQRLVRKGEDPAQAREAVQWMSELELLDDEKVAQQVVSRCIAKGYGPARARQALYEKKVPKEYWDDVLADYPEMTEKIEDFLRARLEGGYDDRTLKKAVDALLRRGHSYGQIRQALNRLDKDNYLED